MRRARLSTVVGGPERLHIVIILASVLGLESADLSAVAAVATQLEHDLRASLIDIGLLVTSSSIIGAFTTLWFGAIVDRFNRTRLLTLVVIAWAGTMVLSGFAQSFLMLLVTRIGLGAVSAAAGPSVASLTGDYFPEHERARIYGYILTGQLLGTGAGLVIAGNIAGIFGWRAAFFSLAIPSLVLALFILRVLDEPERYREAGPSESAVDRREVAGDALLLDAIERGHVEPDPVGVLRIDPLTMTLGEAIRHIFRVRTNVLLTVASSLGYFFLAGVQTFAIVFVRGRFNLSQSTAIALVPLLGVGSLAGTLLGGRLADHLLHRGKVDARIVVGGVAYCAGAFLALPSLVFTSLIVTVPFFMASAAAISAANPPLDAARLDIMHSRLWGRAEGVRTSLRTLMTAAAPLIFGVTADEFGANRLGNISSGYLKATTAGAQGLDDAFLIMLVPLFVSGIIVLASRRRYPIDVASAVASQGLLATGAIDEKGRERN